MGPYDPRYGRVLDVNRETGMVIYHKYDHATKETTVTQVQDPTPWIEENKRVQREATTSGGRLSDLSRNMIKNSWWWVARIPDGVALQWLHLHGVDVFNKDHWPRVKKLLNAPEWRYLRIGIGRI